MNGLSGCFGTIVEVPYKTKGDAWRPFAMDPVSHALIVTTSEHYEVHEGEHYFVDSFTDLAINNVLDVQLTTPDATKWAHLRFRLDTESETQWFLYEGVTINVAGTAFTPRNNNRNVTTASTMTVGIITNTSVANANSDTAVAGATQLAAGIVGAGVNESGHDDRADEIVLKQNTAYSFRAVATAAGFVDFKLRWYEHTSRD